MVKMLKRLLSIVLAVCMVMSMLSMTALADTQDEEPVVPAGEEAMDPAEDQADGADVPADEEAMDAAEDQDDEAGVPAEEEATVKFPIDGGNFVVDLDVASGTYVVTFTGEGWLNSDTVNRAKAELEKAGIKQWAAVIGSGVTAIGQSAFNPHGNEFNDSTKDTTLTSVVIGANVTSIGKWAFWGCAALESVTFANGSKWTGAGSADAQFQFCTSLPSIELPDSMTKIPGYCFAGCTSLAKVSASNGDNFPDGLKTIEERAFESCYALNSIKFPQGLEKIGTYAFADSNVTAAPVVLPASLTKMENYAFSGTNFRPDTAKEIYYEGYTVYGYWSHSRVFCLNGGHYDYNNMLPSPDKPGHTFKGWHQVEPSKLNELDELDENTLVRHGDGTLATIGEVNDTALFPPNFYYFADWYCGFTLKEYEPKCLTSFKVVRVYDCGKEVEVEISALGHEYSKTEDASKTERSTITENGIEYNVVKKYYPCIRNDAYDCKEEKTPVPTYTVTYLDGEETVGTQTYYEGDTIDRLAGLTKDGYTFNGWAPALPTTMPANDLVVKAQWEEKKEEQKPDPKPDPDPKPEPEMCTVSFDRNGGNFIMRALILKVEVKVEKGSTLNKSGRTMPLVARDGFEFTIWQDENGKEFTADTPVEGNMTVKAQWQCGHEGVDDLTTWTKTKDGEVTKPTTCTEAGSKEILCAVCDGKLYDQPIAATGHKPGEKVVTAPKCLEDGSEVVTCTVCNTELSNTKIDSYGGHDEYYTEEKHGVVVREATEDQDGLKRWTCRRDGCGATREEPISYETPEPTVDPTPSVAAPIMPIVPSAPSARPSVPAEPIQTPDAPEESEEISDDVPPLAEMPDLPEDPEEPEEISDDVPPLAETPDLPEESEEISDNDPPLAEGPDLSDDPEESEEIPSDDLPLAEEPELLEAPSKIPQSTPSADNEEEIEEPDVPRAEVPQTGDQLVFWLGAAALSGSGLVLVSAVSRKRKEEDGK